jgi:hypothetical protein
MKKIMIMIALLSALAAGRAMSDDLTAQRIFSVSGGEYAQCVEYDAENDELWLGTSAGLYRSPDLGGTWEKHELPPGGLSVTGITFNRGNIVISTQHGLYAETGGKKAWARVTLKRALLGAVKTGEDTVISWDKAAAYLLDVSDRTVEREIGNEVFHGRIDGAAFSGGFVYVLTDETVYSSGNNMGTWDSFLMEKSSAEEIAMVSIGEGADNAAEKEEKGGILSINADGEVIVGGHDVLYELKDGKVAGNIPLSGITAGRVRNAVKVGDCLYIVTDKDVLKLADDGGLWKRVFSVQGDDRGVSLRSFSGKPGGRFLTLLTSKGVFLLSDESMTDIRKTVSESQAKVVNLPLVTAGPDLISVHRAAVTYSDVQPEKIERWKQQARIKALMPKVDVDMSRSTGENVEIYTSATTSYSVCGPKDTSNGWRLGLSWDLADLIWSTDQTSIDTRSKLNAELRNEILQDVTRLYFERKKLVGEMASGRVRARDLPDKLLRVEELTAYIDAYTGGWFSKELAGAPNN